MAPPPTSDHEQLFRDALEQVQDGVHLLTENFNSFATAVNEAIDNLNRLGFLVLWSPGVGLWLKHGLGQVQDVVIDAVDLVAEVLERSTPVLSLIMASFRWITEVQTPLSDISPVASKPRDQNMYYWSGAAASLYRDRASGQQSAVNQASTLAAHMSEWLFDIAESNIDYAVQLAKMLTSLAGKLAAAVVEAAGVVTAPWALEQLSQSLSDTITDTLNVLLEIGLRLVEAVGNIRDLTSATGDHTALPGGKWPDAVVG